jgi:hypothetical protein
MMVTRAFRTTTLALAVARTLTLMAALAGLVTGPACTRVVDAVQPGAGDGSSDCTLHPSNPGCGPTPWPTPTNGANSDPWIVDHHDTITVMRPRLLVLNFFNGVTVDAVRQTAERQIAAVAEGSRYHGYDDALATPFLAYEIAKVVDLTDHPPSAGWNNPSSMMLPVNPNGAFDPQALFTSRFSSLYGFTDPTTPARSLSLCELFERGIINEVWIEDGESGIRHAPFNVERKQIYDGQNQAIPGSFLACGGGGGCLQDVICGVTVRMAHLDPMRGPGCDLFVRGWGIEGMWDALPAFAPEAMAFLNRDFRTRFKVAFDGWENLCDQTSTRCINYPSPSTATGTYTNGTPWTIDPFVQGCGSTAFPPNAHYRYDYTSNTPVQSRCEHFGLGDGIAGVDALEPYTADKITAANQAFGDCGGGWQIYWRQSLPGRDNHAKTSDGRAMRNWWPLLFY